MRGLLLVVPLLVGCSGIRVVSAAKTGGEIALVGNREAAMQKARSEMDRACGGPTRYEIVDMSSVATGDKAEWRVKYSCKDH